MWWAFLALLVLALASAAWTGLVGGMWSPTPARVVHAMLAAAGLEPGETLYDLGAGDGRIIMAAARTGARAVGVEIDPLRCLYIRLRLLWSRPGQAELVRADFFRVDLTPADVVCTYLSQGAVDRLSVKLAHELKPTARVVSYRRPLPGWPLLHYDAENQVYCYAPPVSQRAAPAS
ncbi:MAG: SAM-dependent methyltransferase [Bacillota bacterium]